MLCQLPLQTRLTIRPPTSSINSNLMETADMSVMFKAVKNKQKILNSVTELMTQVLTVYDANCTQILLYHLPILYNQMVYGVKRTCNFKGNRIKVLKSLYLGIILICFINSIFLVSFLES